MPPPLDSLAKLAVLPDAQLSQQVEATVGNKPPIQYVLYDVLRHEHALSAETQPVGRTESARILDLAQAAYGELLGALIGRADGLLDHARDGDWSLRDVLRHAIAVELRYGAQVEYSALRRDEEPVAIPNERLPCDRVSPPEPQYADTRTAGFARIVELLGTARATTDGRLASIANVALTRPSLWGTQPMTVRMRLHQVAAHLIECVIQSEKLLAAEPASEARQILRRICVARGAHERWSRAAARADLDERVRRLAAVC
jgi:DinB family protein